MTSRRETPVIGEQGVGSQLTVHQPAVGTSFRRALSLLHEVGPWQLIALILMTVMRGALPGLQVYAVGVLVSVIADSGLMLSGQVGTPLTLIGMSMIGAYVLENMIRFAGDRLTSRLSFMTDVSTVEKLGTFEVADFERSSTFDAIKRVDGSTGEHVFGLFDSGRAAIQGALSILSVATVIAAWNPWIAVALVVAPIPASIAAFRLQTLAFEVEYSRAPRARLAQYFRSLLSSEASMREAKIFGLVPLFQSKYVALRRTFLSEDLRLARMNVTHAGSLGLISSIASFVAIVIATRIAISTGRIGELASFITASSQMNSLVMGAILGLTSIYQHLLYVSNWVRVIDHVPAVIEEGSRSLAVPSLDPCARSGVAVEFRGVSFRYPGSERLVLDEVSFIIAPGETAAIVGLNGSGKTTICKLLLRFYEPISGSILVDGKDIRSYSRESLYSQFSALFQDFIKYERSLGDNISYGLGRDFESGQFDDDIAESLSLVGLDFLRSDLSDGLNTILGKRFAGGQQLSIGQWQRVATSRALHKRPRLLVLDEPTASVDAVSERSMFEALATVDAAVTTILVAHRSSTIRHAEHIIVLSDGRVIGEGDHQSLLNSCVLYGEMFSAQADAR